MRRSLSVPLWGLFLLAVLITAGTAWAGDGGSATPQPQAHLDVDQNDTAPGTSHMRVFKDPETGALLPAPVQPAGLSTALARALNRSSEGLKPEIRLDGTVLLHLQGRFQSMSVVHRAEDGTLHSVCSHDADTVQAMLSGSIAHPEPEDR